MIFHNFYSHKKIYFPLQKNIVDMYINDMSWFLTSQNGVCSVCEDYTFHVSQNIRKCNL